MTENKKDGSTRALLAIAIILVIVSVVFLADSVSLTSAGEVAAGLLSALIGFALLASSITLFRLWGALRLREEKG